MPTLLFLLAVLGAPLSDTTRIARVSALVSAQPHVAGDRANPKVLAALLGELQAAGLDTMRTPFRAYLPQPRGPQLQRTQPYPGLLPNIELRVGEDSLTFSGIWPIFSPYSPDGDIEAPVVYVNEGRAADYRTLDSVRVSPSGTWLIARRSSCAPWAVARAAKAHGARGLLLYSDPARDGYMQGETYPDGRMRHPDAAERMLARAGVGDPGLEGAANAVPLPVIPIGYKVANQLMSLLLRPSLPNAWQGALPFRYHAGYGEVRLRAITDSEKGDTGWKDLANGFATIRGRRLPNEVIVIGAHYDALGPGAVDNGSGVAVAVEVAARLAAAQRAGWAPERTIIVALWDGSEWGAIGSTAWLRSQADSTLDRIVAYVDLKRVAAGDSLQVTGAPLLADAAFRALRAAPLVSRTVLATRDAAVVRPRPGPSDAAVMHEGFGIPAIRIAYDGQDATARTGYDTPMYLRRFVDPGWQRHDAVASMVTALVRDLAAAGPAAYAPQRLVAAIQADARPTADVSALLPRLAGSAARTTGFERRLLAAEGREPFGWSRHLLFGTDAECGERIVALPFGGADAVRALTRLPVAAPARTRGKSG